MESGSALPPADQQSEPDSAAGEPSARSLHMGLYVVPALFVLLFVSGWLFVYWMLHESQDPQSLVQGMQQPGRRSWQRAYALSQLLSDPRHPSLKDDQALCAAVAATLEQQNRLAHAARRAGRPEDAELTRFRAFLCHTLGEFRVSDGLPILLTCAAAETSHLPSGSHEADVRRAALEAIAVLATQGDVQQLRANPQTLPVLRAATNVASGAAPASTADIASAATFALGLIGGPQATAHLLGLLADGRPDVRYNAATGLARHARPESIPVLLEMLTPENDTIARSEKTASARQRKRLMIWSNGIAAARRVYAVAGPPERRQLAAALVKLRDSPHVNARVYIDAKQALLTLADRGQANH